MRRTTMTLSAVTLTAAVLSACGSPAGDSSSGNSGEQNTSSGSFDSVTSLVNASSQSMTDKDTVRMAIDIAGGPQGGQHLDCQADLGNQGVACSGDQEMVATGDAVYVKVPQMAELGGESGKPWMKTDISELGQGMGDVSQFQDLQSMLPPGTEITGTSQDQVDEQQATKYETVTDVRKAVQESPEQQKKMLQPVLDAGVSELRQTVWVSEDDLPIRVRSTMPPMEVMGQQVPEMTTTVNYSAWGEPVDITVPPAEQVQEMPDMGGGAPQMPN
ncbi:hypothetical protein [Bounagaea algeriensis]